MAQLIARTPPHCRVRTRPRLLLLAHHLPSRYTAFLLLLRTTAARSLLVYKESKRANE